MGQIKISIIIPVYNSHRAFYRQMRHWKRLDLPDSVEWLIMDDMSEPPLDPNHVTVRNLFMFRTYRKRHWEEGYVCNRAAELARGEYIFHTDIDHIVSREAIEAVLQFDGDKMIFPRYFAVLDNAGRVIQDLDVLRQWGLHEKYLKRSLNGGTHGNTWAMKRSIFLELGGYRHRTPGRYSGYLDSDLNNRYTHAVVEGKVLAQKSGPRIFCFPMGRFTVDNNNNPHGFFHDLPRGR